METLFRRQARSLVSLLGFKTDVPFPPPEAFDFPVAPPRTPGHIARYMTIRRDWQIFMSDSCWYYNVFADNKSGPEILACVDAYSEQRISDYTILAVAQIRDLRVERIDSC